MSQERLDIASRVYSKYDFPDCVGFVDGTHIGLSQEPKKDGEDFYNRKGFYSFNVQVVCDDEKVIRFLQVGRPGSMADSTIFKSSAIYRNDANFLSENEYLLGDSGYALEKGRILTPFRSNQIRDDSDSMFNKRHAPARVVVENTIGILKNRWKMLKRIHRQYNKPNDGIEINELIIACAVLHNIMIKTGDHWPVISNKEHPESSSGIPTLDDKAWRDHIKHVVLTK